MLTRHSPHGPEVEQCAGLAVPVADVAVDAQRLLQRLGPGRIIARHPPQVPQIVQGAGLAVLVADMPCGPRGGSVAVDGIGPGTVAPPEPGEPGGQSDDPGVLAGCGGMVQAGEQAGALSAG